jgi:hypothetical protein
MERPDIWNDCNVLNAVTTGKAETTGIIKYIDGTINLALMPMRTDFAAFNYKTDFVALPETFPLL